MAYRRRRSLGDDLTYGANPDASQGLVLDASSLQNNPSLSNQSLDTALWTNASNPLDFTSWFGGKATPVMVSKTSVPAPPPFSAPPGGVLNAALNTAGLGNVGAGTWAAVAVIGALTLILILKR